MSTTDDGYDPYAGLNVDLCLEVDAMDLNNTDQQGNDDYDPYEVFMRMNTRRTVNGRDRAPLAVLPSHTTATSPLANNYRHYNFADDDTPVKYPLAIGHVDRRVKPPNVKLLLDAMHRSNWICVCRFEVVSSVAHHLTRSAGRVAACLLGPLFPPRRRLTVNPRR